MSTLVWTELTTFAVALLSSVFPAVNLEVYLVGLGTAHATGASLANGLAAGLGQTLGKVALYFVANRSLEAPWLKRKLEKPKVAASIEKWRTRTAGRPIMATGILFLSALSGFPPLLALAVVAGVVRVPLYIFVPAVFVGRVIRFYLILSGAEAIHGWLPWEG